MGSKKIMATVLGSFVVGTLVLFVVTGAVYADDADTATNSFVTRVAELLGVEEEKVADAFEQAHEEGYGPMHHGRFGAMHEALEACTGVSSEEWREAVQASEGATMGEVLSSLGVEDIDSVEQCLTDEKLAHVDQLLEDGRIDQDQALEMKSEIEEHMEDFEDHEVGKGPKGMGMHEGMGRGMRGGYMYNSVSESGVQ